MRNMYNDILSKLSDSTAPLQDVLLKLKILACRLNNQNLINFVNSELNGYQNVKVPQYRCISGVLIGTVSNGYHVHRDTRLPTFHLKKHRLEDIELCEMSDSVGTLISYADAEEDNLNKIIPPELYGMLSETYDNGYVVQRAYVPISKAQIKGILTSIRSTILDLIFAIEQEINVSEMENLFDNPTKDQIDRVNPVVNQFFITSFGDSTQNTKIELGSDK